MRITRLCAVIGVLTLGFLAPAQARQEAVPVVRGVLFFSPSCGHCEYVIQEVLPPLYLEHGGAWDVVYDEGKVGTGVAYLLLTNGTLELLLVDVTVPEGSEFFQTATDALAIGSNGVPRLVVGNQVMIGSTDIPNRFPILIEDGLAGNGIDWPAIPGVDAIVQSIPGVVTTTTTSDSSSTTVTTAVSGGTTPTSVASPAPIETSAITLPIGSDDSVVGRFGSDPLANSVAVVVLLALLGSLLLVGLMRKGIAIGPASIAIPILVVAGVVIAGYLTYVEVGSVEAVCGPVGDCNAVQQSDYARVAGIPIGLVGLAGYLTLGFLWLRQRSATDRRADLARVAMAAIALGGVAFSAWLTFLEPFVIGATCVWCLGSAVVIGALLWLTVPAGRAAWGRIAPPSVAE